MEIHDLVLSLLGFAIVVICFFIKRYLERFDKTTQTLFELNNKNQNSIKENQMKMIELQGEVKTIGLFLNGSYERYRVKK